MPRVHFNEPIVTEIKARAPAERPHALSYHEISALVRKLRDEGFDERAIVVHRVVFPNGMPNKWLMGNPMNWGVVRELRTTVIMGGTEPYRPIKVQWAKDGQQEYYWPEDLILIHSAISQYGVEQVIKEQLDD